MSLTPNVEPFIARWKASGASERANYQLFLTELCDLLGMETPRPASDKILERQVALNRECAPEEAHGLVRWLQHEDQNLQGVQQTGIAIEAPEVAAKVSDKELVP